MNITQTKENYFFMLGHLATDLCHGSLPIILAYMYQQGRLDSYASVALLMMANTILSAFVQPIAGGLADGKKPRPYLMSLFSFLWRHVPRFNSKPSTTLCSSLSKWYRFIFIPPNRWQDG